MFFVLMLLTSVVASPQYSPPRIELLAPPIPISYSSPHVPVSVYGAPSNPSEGSFISPVPTPPNQAPVAVPPAQPAGSIPSPAPIADEKFPIRSPEELVQIPERSINVPEGSNEIVLPPGTSISLRDDLGQFSHGFSDKNGTTVSEQGRLLTTNDGWEAVIIKKGFYSYISPDGTPISVSYIADENGFRAKGDHIPSK